MSTVGPIYTAHIAYPIATPDVVRNEIRAAVEQGRAPVPLRTSVTNPNVLGDRIGAGIPIPLGTMPVGTAPVVQNPPFVPLLTPYQPSSVVPAPAPGTATPPATTRYTAKFSVAKNMLIGGAALAGGAAIAYFLFR